MNTWTLSVLGLLACSTATEQRAAPALDGPPQVRVDAYGPVSTPRVIAVGGRIVEPEWTIQASEVAVVDEGDVKAIGPGETRITAEVDGHEIHWTLVVEPSIAIQFVDPPDHVDVDADESLTVEGRLDEDVVDPGALQWSSSNESVATVADDGTVHGVAEGITYVTAKGTTGEAMIELQVLEP